MAIPTPEQFQKNLERRKAAKAREIAAIRAAAAAPPPTELHELAPLVLILAGLMKAQGKVEIDCRELVRDIRDGGIETPRDELFRIVKSIMETLQFPIAVQYPTTWKMPAILPVVEDGKIVQLTVMVAPEESPEPGAAVEISTMTAEERKERLQYFMRNKLPEWEAKQLAQGRSIKS